jgi:uncharacterized protein YbaR (Trm112 family)
MARIIGGITTSPVPAIGRAIAKNLQQEPYWKPFFDGFPPIREWLAAQRPDVVVVFYNDHGLNFFLDKMPTFAVGAAPQYRNADEGWGIPQVPPYFADVADPQRCSPAQKRICRSCCLLTISLDACGTAVTFAEVSARVHAEAALRADHALHALVMDVHVVEGALVCPNCARSYPIKKGIPNMLLREDEL